MVPTVIPMATCFEVTQVNGNAANVGNEITLASGALLTLRIDGTFDYNPNGAFESLAVGEQGMESFTYQITDINGEVSNPGTVTITIDGVNDAPVATDDSGVDFTTDEDNSFTTGNVLDNDSDTDVTDILSVSGFDTTGNCWSRGQQRRWNVQLRS